MIEIIKLLFLGTFPPILSLDSGTVSYCNYLFWKYAKSEEYYNKYIEKPYTKKTSMIWKNNPSDKELKKILKKNDEYKKAEERSKDMIIKHFCLDNRPLISKTEINYYYPKDRPRRKRFDFFMILTKINIIITLILLLSIIIFAIFDIFSYSMLKYIFIIKAILIDGFCILCCIPFGFFRNAFFRRMCHKWKV